MKPSTIADRTNADWLSALRRKDTEREAALADLRAIILVGLPHALAGWLSPTSEQFDALAEDVAQETLLRVLDNLNSFEQRSYFTTWVYKIAVRVALTELRRRRWRDVSLDALSEVRGEALMAMDIGMTGRLAEQNDMLKTIQQMMDEELTEKQRTALMATGIQGMPLEEVAQRMGTTRNALYKLLHDARLRLKRRLAREGLTSTDVLSMFEQG
jgi:RNA polymerase sigma-70 factor (ECF subfamily)